jgi:putative oxidoreductase
MNIINLIDFIFNKFNAAGDYISMLVLRLFIAWEFWESGIVKFNGDNWFTDIQDAFPFPFNIIPTEISWFISTWTEIVGAIAIAVGLATRFTVVSFIVLDIVAWVSVHSDNGYNVCSNGFKLPLMYLIILVPLLLTGPGKASIDALIKQRYSN